MANGAEYPEEKSQEYQRFENHHHLAFGGRDGKQLLLLREAQKTAKNRASHGVYFYTIQGYSLIILRARMCVRAPKLA